MSEQDLERGALDLDAIEARANAATPEWMQAHNIGEPRAIVQRSTPTLSMLGLDRDGMAIFWKESDAAFAVHARSDVPALCAEVRRLRQEVANLGLIIDTAAETEGEVRAVCGAAPNELTVVAVRRAVAAAPMKPCAKCGFERSTFAKPAPNEAMLGQCCECGGIMGIPWVAP